MSGQQNGVVASRVAELPAGCCLALAARCGSGGVTSPTHRVTTGKIRCRNALASALPARSADPTRPPSCAWAANGFVGTLRRNHGVGAGVGARAPRGLQKGRRGCSDCGLETVRRSGTSQPCARAVRGSAAARVRRRRHLSTAAVRTSVWVGDSSYGCRPQARTGGQRIALFSC